MTAFADLLIGQPEIRGGMGMAPKSAVPYEVISELTTIELLLMRGHESGSTTEQLAVLLGLDLRKVKRAKARLRTKLQTLPTLEEGLGDVEI
jgi:hypothetical protein